MKKLIVISGPSCAGKSTLIERLFLQRQDLFWLKYDAIKRFFVDYEPTRDVEKVQALVAVIGRDRIAKGENILLENYLEEVVEFAKVSGYAVYCFNIEAPYPVLLERFQARVTNAKEGVKINTSKERHRDLYDAYFSHKQKGGMTLDTSILSKEEAVKKIIEVIGVGDSLP
jgi:predicted kinase